MVCGVGSITQSNIFNVKEFSVEPLHLFPNLIGQGTEVVSPSPFFNAASGLGRARINNIGARFSMAPLYRQSDEGAYRNLKWSEGQDGQLCFPLPSAEAKAATICLNVSGY
jgi:hypothetical protein